MLSWREKKEDSGAENQVFRRVNAGGVGISLLCFFPPLRFLCWDSWLRNRDEVIRLQILSLIIVTNCIIIVVLFCYYHQENRGK